MDTYDPNHGHAVASTTNGWSFQYDANGNQTSRTATGGSYALSYDAENRLVGVSGAASAVFVYDGDGKRVKATLNSVTTTYVGNYYETSGSSVRKYYFFGALRVAMRQDSTLSYLFGDHLGYTSITADSRGNKTAEMRCLAGGEQRYHAGQVSFHGASGQDEA